MTYIPKSDAAKEIHQVYGDLSTAQHQWNTYAEKLGQAYTIAYREHEKPLKDISEKLRASSEAMYFVLSLFCVGLGGGLAGGLMAPWVNKAGDAIGKAIMRTTISEATQSTVGGVTQKIIDATKNGSPYTPVVKEPLEYSQHMKGQIGECFSIIRDEVENEVIEADKQGAPRNYGIYMRQKLVAMPLVGDHPKSKDLPDVATAARQAELGMWIAWANVRDIDYWNRAIKSIENYGKSKWLGPSGKDMSYLSDAERLSSIVSRLYTLGEHSRVVIPHPQKPHWREVKYGTPVYKSPLLHIPKLAMLGKQLGGTFYSKLDDVVRSPVNARGELSKLLSLPPIYKR
jgi:hypothetical protein